MQVVILCGGKGTRLLPLTETLPKSLVIIENHPFIYYQLMLLKSHGINEILLCTGVFGHKIKEYLEINNMFGMNIHISEEHNQLGTGGALMNAKYLLNDTFFVTYGDSYPLSNLSAIVKQNNMLVTIFKNKLNNNIEIINGKVKYANTPTATHIDCGFIGMSKTDVVSGVYNLFNLFDGADYFEVMEPSYEIGSFEGLEQFKQMVNHVKLFK